MHNPPPSPHPHRIGLLVADMDSTMIDGETLDDLAALAGCGDQVMEITNRSMRGEIDFAQSLQERVALLAGKNAGLMDQVIARMRPMAGAADLIRHAGKLGIRTVLVTGGFVPCAAHAAKMLGFDAFHANDLLIENGVFTGHVALPVLDAQAKAAILRQEGAALHLKPEQIMAIGDGANDLPMLREAGLGVGYYPKDIVAQTMRYNIFDGDLRDLIPVLG